MSFTRRFLEPPEPEEHPLCYECIDECLDYPCQKILDAIEANEKEIQQHEEAWLKEREIMMDQISEREI